MEKRSVHPPVIAGHPRRSWAAEKGLGQMFWGIPQHVGEREDPPYPQVWGSPGLLPALPVPC